MTEDDYILATNLQKFRIVADLLHDALPSDGLTEEQLKELSAMASGARDRLFDVVNSE